MFISIGGVTVNTDHITRIDWAGKSIQRGRDKVYEVPCVHVHLSTTSSDDGGGFSADALAFFDHEAAQLATWFKGAATNLNLITPDAIFLDHYPKAETLEPTTHHYNEDIIPF